MNVLLTGATGFIGRNVAAALAAAGHRMLPLSRRDGVDFATRLAPDDWLPHLDGVDAVINSVGILAETSGQSFKVVHTLAPAALFRACAEKGVPRVVQISALGADGQAFSAYHRSKRAADDELRSLDLDWFVLRPSLIYGRGGNSAALFMGVSALPVIPVVGDGRQRLQPVHIGDVVATVMHCLGCAETRLTLDLVGPESVTVADWLQRMRCAQGLSPAPWLQIPYAVAMAITFAGRGVHPILQPDNLRMLQFGYAADTAPLAAFLGRAPLAARRSLFFADAAGSGALP